MKSILFVSVLIGVTSIVFATRPTVTGLDKPAPVPSHSNGDKKAAPPHIEVCFVLDTTGSMGGLIEGAKQKIWSISNEIVKAKPVPVLNIGLVAYRDRADEYITKSFPLTDDIDSVYAHLMALRAEGGGDEPESVNAALAEAVRKMDWSTDSHVLKLIFLVGDAPPHMDYPDDVKYPEICQEAVKKNIIINSVQCGSLPETTPDWQKIARLGEGQYTSVGETGDVAIVATPMDKKLADLTAAIGKTLVPYDKAEDQREVRDKQAVAEASFAAPASAAAASDRLYYNVNTKKAVQGNHELVADYATNSAVLEKVPQADLPASLQNKKPEEIAAYLKQQQATRIDLQKQIGEISRQREKYIAEQRANQAGHKDSFDDEVAKILRAEAAKIGLNYE
ncbi:MAG TPA: vWA domain-containing protein [Candidatus Methylacidiphilales bacterium]